MGQLTKSTLASGQLAEVAHRLGHKAFFQRCSDGLDALKAKYKDEWPLIEVIPKLRLRKNNLLLYGFSIVRDLFHKV
jgi:hypothetical protein